MLGFKRSCQGFLNGCYHNITKKYLSLSFLLFKDHSSEFREALAAQEYVEPDQMVTIVDAKGITIGSMTKTQAQNKAADLKKKMVFQNIMPDKLKYPVYKLLDKDDTKKWLMGKIHSDKLSSKKIEKFIKVSYKIKKHDLDIQIGKVKNWLSKHYDISVTIQGPRNRSLNEDGDATNLDHIFTQFRTALQEHMPNIIIRDVKKERNWSFKVVLDQELHCA